MIDKETFTDDELIVDECLTFILAGSMTTSSATANNLAHLMMNERIEKKVRDSLSKNFKKFGDATATIDDLA
jgi:cytochrome P450